jgi:hypothetical protein
MIFTIFRYDLDGRRLARWRFDQSGRGAGRRKFHPFAQKPLVLSGKRRPTLEIVERFSWMTP